MALCHVYVKTKDPSCEKYIKKYLTFIRIANSPMVPFLTTWTNNLHLPRRMLK
jgi:hypothetical protein